MQKETIPKSQVQSHKMLEELERRESYWNGMH